MRPFPLMLFAAGFGTRMRELTAIRPKPLVPVLGETLLDRALKLAEDAACAPVVVNVHYLGGQIIDHLAGRPGVQISDERAAILDTGGGLRAALPTLGPGPVMTLNPDAVWRGPNPLSLLAKAWEGDRMDALLLVKDRAQVRGRSGKADFRLDAEGRITRAVDETGSLYLGAQILRTDALSAITEPVFSLNRLWDRMIAEGRAYALPYAGDWCDVGSPEGLAEAEAMLREGG
ncbi:nucleotidyltransferase family protein [Fuscovulum blasticum]|uniref:nucleotidyltransferase family protein n=1 Tax=Fuscovulum blasticum TaxID=1075 RepID=UPI000D3E7B7D|nr:nucleotidyltransferase family protein [Fuscovulum blasticum]AWD22017.1 nucleotidyltransferase [Fuscovulum blasticum]